jgi:hypothetical protein
MPGGGVLSAMWQYHDNVNPPPGVGQVRTNSTSTEMYLSKLDDGGFNRADGLALIQQGMTVQFKGSSGGDAVIEIVGAPVDNGTWMLFPISVKSGLTDPKRGTIIEVMFVQPESPMPLHANAANRPPGTWTFQVVYDPDTGALYTADGFGNWLGYEPPIVGGVAPNPRAGRMFFNVNERKMYVSDGSAFYLMYALP